MSEYERRKMIRFIRGPAIEDFPFHVGDSQWIVTQEIRDKFDISEWARINFDLRFSDGSSLIEEKYSNMLHVIQELLRLKWGFSKNNLRTYWAKLSFFIEFLVNVRGVCCLSDAWGVDEYVAYRKSMGNLKGIGRKGACITNPWMTADSLMRYLIPVKDLYHFSAQMKHGLKIEPWIGRSAAKVAGVHQHDYVNRVSPYDLRVFAGFIRVAKKDLETVDGVCELILSRTDYRQRVAAANRLRTAAALALCATVGMRSDEIYALEIDCLKNGSLNTDEGPVAVTWVHGRIFKGEPPGGRSHRWLASDEAILAVETMIRLWQAFEEAIKLGVIPPKQIPALERSRGWLFPKFHMGNRNRSLKSKISLWSIKQYIQRPVCREFLGEDTVVTHQRFRPTIARAFGRLQLGDVTYFKAHFGHAWWTTTRGYFLTFADDELQAEVSEFANSEAQNLLHEVLSSRFPLQGGRGCQIEQHRREYPVMTFETKKALLRSLQRGHQIRIGPQSLCMARNGSALCSQDCLYEEENCLRCPNGVIVSMHLPAWEDMWRRNRALLNDLPLGSPGEIAISENLKEIEVAIRNMGGSIPT